MSRAKDLTNQKFNHLTVIKRSEDYINENGRKYVMWACECDCGNIITIRSDALTSNNTRSCGCLKQGNKVHDLYYTTQRKILSNMKQRCYNPKNNAYENYGGRGIKICDDWLDSKKGLINFYQWSIESGFEEGLTIDRINNDGGYEPSNCRWISKGKQNRNKRSNVYATIDGKTELIVDLAKRYNKKYRTVMSRYESGFRGRDLIDYEDR